MKMRISCSLLAALMLLSLMPGNVRAAKQEPLVLHRQERRDFTSDDGTILYYYDQDGRCVYEKWEDKELTVEYTYSAENVLKKKIVFNKATLMEETIYDDHGNPWRTTTHSPDHGVTTYENTYDALGRMTECVMTTQTGATQECVQSNWTYGDGLPVLYRKGDTFTMGSYEQDGKTSNGAEPILWQVLETKGSKVLAISVDGLETRAFHGKLTSAQWKTCDLRSWLNKDFLNGTFTQEESTRIQSTSTEKVSDKVFLLSQEEAEKYFESNEQRVCKPSDYAAAQKPITLATTGGGTWLLRSAGTKNNTIASVYGNGRIESDSVSITNSKVLVRPAMWVDTSGMKESIVRYHSTTEYTVKQNGDRAIQSKERYTYDEYGGLTQYYVEATDRYTRNYDYTNTYFMDQLIRSNSVCTDYDDPQGDSESECYYSYDLDGRLIRKMHLTSGGAGTYEETWEYDDLGNLLTYVEQGLEREVNEYVPLSQAQRKSK